MKKYEIVSLINTWSETGTISAEQAQYMIADVEKVTGEQSGHKFISAITNIGATALSLGALLLIASNWPGLSKGMKLFLTLLLPLVPLCFAYWQLVIKNEERTLGRAANILGLTLVGGSLALIDQTYNLDVDMVSYMWIWALLTAPFVFVFRKNDNVLFSAVAIGAALLFSIFDLLETSNIDESAGVLLLTMTGLVYAGVLYIVGSALRHSQAWLTSARYLRVGAAGLVSSILFITTFEWYARVVVNSTYSNPGNWEMLSIALNLIFIAFLVYALIRAAKHEEYDFAFSIVRLFGVYLLVKYYTLFYTMFDTGLFFMIGGIIFITGGWFLEKKKDLLLSYMKGAVPHTHSYDQ